MTIRITIQNKDENTVMDFTEYREAIDYLDALENKEIDENHHQNMLPDDDEDKHKDN